MTAPVSPEVFVLTRPATLSGVIEQHAQEMRNSHELYAQVRGLQAWIERMHRLYPEH